jgi:hypothetical protein
MTLKTAKRQYIYSSAVDLELAPFSGRNNAGLKKLLSSVSAHKRLSTASVV